MKYPNLQELSDSIEKRATAVPQDVRIPEELCHRLEAAWDRCLRHNESSFTFRSGVNRDQEVSMTHRNVIQSAIGSELTETLLDFQEVYTTIFDKLEISPTTKKRLFNAKTDATTVGTDWIPIEKEINALNLDDVEKNHLKKFGLDNAWSGCTKSIARGDFFYSSICSALGTNPTRNGMVATASKDFLSADVLRSIRDELIEVGTGTYVTTSTVRKAVNTIFFGSPGTGKSYRAKTEAGSGIIFRTLFHPEFTYSDFVGMYRPVVGFEKKEDKIDSFDGQIIQRPVNYFEFVAGPLIRALGEAFKNPQQNIFLLIEEINRGDCAAIFGDIFQLLDRDDRGRSEYGIQIKSEIERHFKSAGIAFDIANDGKLYFPENFSLLATMNTSDQSLYPMDSAFKRRWDWISCPIDFSGLSSGFSGREVFLNDGKYNWNWAELIKVLNKRIALGRMEDKQIGPWFIKPKAGGEIEYKDFLNKCLFYLWHDVFKDEQASDDSPFKPDAGLNVFHAVQQAMKVGGLEAVFKTELLSSVTKLDDEPPISGDA